MEYVKFGKTGMKVSKYCLGTMGIGSSKWRPWVLDADASSSILKHALDVGVNFFDLANFYSMGENERVVGETLLSLTKRDNLILASKAFYAMSDDVNDQGLSRKHLLSSIDSTLTRLGTDYLDVFMIHAFDNDTPIEETMCALNDIVRSGKARYIGASTMYAWQFAQMNAIARQNGWATFVNMQCQHSLLYREEEREMVPYCRDQGIAVSTFSPLARGMLTGTTDIRTKTDNFTADFFGDEIDMVIIDRVKQVAQKRDCSSADIAFSWVANGGVSDVPLIGVQNIEQLDASIAATKITLTQQELNFIEEPYRPRDMINDHNPIRRSRSVGVNNH